MAWLRAGQASWVFKRLGDVSGVAAPGVLGTFPPLATGALIEIYLYSFTNIELEIFNTARGFALCGIEISRSL